MEANKFIAVKVNPKVQSFSPGDTVRVGMRIKEGERERVQAFQGVVIKTGGRPPATSFTVRRVTYGVGVERIFRLYSPLLVGVEVLRRGDVRRANLTYLRSLFGKAARIREKAWTGVAVAKGVAEEPAQEAQPAAASAEQPAPADEAASAPVAAAEAPAQKPQDKPAAQ